MKNEMFVSQEERINLNADIFLSKVMTLEELSKATGFPKEQLEYEFENLLIKISPKKYKSVNRIICYLNLNCG